MSRPVLIFDMDGVLVDVTESYRETICRTVERFTGVRASREEIQDLKNQGGWNDDWRLSHHLICRSCPDVPFDAVVEYFQSIFHGNGKNGLILREEWIARDGLFDRLGTKFQLAIFTGRLRWEAELTLQRFAPAIRFDPIIGSGDIERLKPAPDGLLRILAETAARKSWYVGDTVDDARSARAAGVPFIGIASPASPRRDQLVELFRQENAVAVLDDLNQLEAVVCG